MLDESEMARYAKGVAAMIGVVGPTPRADAVGILRALHHAEEEAADVLAYALSHGILAADGDTLRARAALMLH